MKFYDVYKIQFKENVVVQTTSYRYSTRYVQITQTHKLKHNKFLLKGRQY